MREEVDDRAVGVDDADAVLHGRSHVEATVGVEAETVARASPEVFDHPLARTVGVHAQQPGLLDHHNGAVGLERDPVAVREAVGEHGDRAVRRVLHHATGRLLGGRPVRRVGEVDRAVGADREVVGGEEPVVGEVGDRTIRLLRAGDRVSPDGTLADLRTVRWRAKSKPPFCVTRIEPSAASAAPLAPPPVSAKCSAAFCSGRHAVERTFGDARHDQRSVAAPHRTFAELRSLAHNLRTHALSLAHHIGLNDRGPSGARSPTNTGGRQVSSGHEARCGRWGST